MKYSVLSLFLVTSCAPLYLPAMNKVQRVVDWTDTTDPKSNIRKVTCQVDAEYLGIKGLITLCKESSIITSKLVRMEGTVTVSTGQAFPIPATDINTCFDMVSALHLTDLRNEEKQRAEQEALEAKKLALATRYYSKQVAWHKPS